MSSDRERRARADAGSRRKRDLAAKRTPFYTGSNDQSGGGHWRPAVHKLARKLQTDELGYNVLSSAGAYLIRDGQELTEAAMLAEARKRVRYLEAVMKRNRERR